MTTDIASYLRFFDSMRGRTERDVAALPPLAAAWRPPEREGEAGWSIGEIVAHIGSSRLYFASTYRGEGSIWSPAEVDRDDQRTWVPWLRASAERFTTLLEETPNDWLTRRIEMIDTPGAVPSVLGRPVSEYGRLCQGAEGHAGGGRCRRALMLTILS